MTAFKVTISEDIEANRLVTLGENATIGATPEGGAPDFHTVRALEEDETVYVEIKGNPTWAIEAGEDLTAGQRVDAGEGGTLIATEGEGIGYVANDVEAGKIATFIQSSSAGAQGPPGKDGAPGKDGSPGKDGKDGFPSEEDWNELVGRVEALEG
ncbi:hypothetical protein J14TS2_17270 [Bacillus sp. J14TS2]|uniref:collagen-like protein n=1 Tax=Bacillus sp. J14TS2 TaxID=2807188 RepID=UPI001B22442D|nr:collagen-like protein [Bacillus sp. J14TS2]GIN71252.1 hypothetical protein J14TS2_17270 [Bacillus sp. J14TS2]